MRVLFFGTADFAVPSLEALLAAGHKILAVVTQPDKPHGRGMQLSASPVKVAAQRLGIPVLQPKRVRSERFIESIREMQPELLALAAFGQIVPQALLDIPCYGPINVHGSLLPAYRGAAPIQRAIMAGETITGVTTMWMEAALDTGDILQKAVLTIDPQDTSGTLFPKLADLGAGLLIQTVAGLEAGSILREPQDESKATYAAMIQPEDGAIRWDEPASVSVNRIRGVSPKPGAFFMLHGKRIKVWRAQAGDNSSSEPAGTIIGYSKRPDGLIIAASENSALLISEVQPESGKRMAADAWARGARLVPGSWLT